MPFVPKNARGKLQKTMDAILEIMKVTVFSGLFECHRLHLKETTEAY